MLTTRKHSRKRDALLELLRGTKAHPGAEWLYQTLKPDFPELSLGTVYRNLALLRREGRIAAVATVQGQERFDADVREHAHFVCRHCGCVMDVEIEDGMQKHRAALSQTGLLVEGHTLQFIGLCEHCRETG